MVTKFDLDVESIISWDPQGKSIQKNFEEYLNSSSNQINQPGDSKVKKLFGDIEVNNELNFEPDNFYQTKLKKSQSVESLFRKRPRRRGSLTLSKSNLTSRLISEGDGHLATSEVEKYVRPKNINDLSRDELRLRGNDEKPKQNLMDLVPDVQEQKEDKFNRSWKHSTFSIFKSVNGYLDKPNNEKDYQKQQNENNYKKEEKKNKNQKSRDNLKKTIFKELHSDMKNMLKLQKQGFSTQNLQHSWRGELSDEKVVPLPKTLFRQADRNYSERYHLHIMTKAIKAYEKPPTKTKRSIRMMLKSFLWKTAPATDSAEIENQIFSPGTHRPSNCDVPGIYELESEEENLDDEEIQMRKRERSRSQSTIGILFGSMSSSSSESKDLVCPRNTSTNELQTLLSASQSAELSQSKETKTEKPSIKKKRSKFACQASKSKSFCVRFLSPTVSH